MPPSLLAVAALGAVHYLIRLVEESSSRRSDAYHAPFPIAYQELIRPYDEIAEAQIAAYTSTIFQQFIQANAIKIHKLRLLIMIGGNCSPTCADTPFDLDDTINKWKALHARRQISKMEIRRVLINSNLYFGIIDKQRAIVGLLWPNPGLDDIKAEEAMVLSKEDEPGVISHLVRWFERVWHVGEVVYTSEKQNKRINTIKIGDSSSQGKKGNNS